MCTNFSICYPTTYPSTHLTTLLSSSLNVSLPDPPWCTPSCTSADILYYQDNLRKVPDQYTHPDFYTYTHTLTLPLLDPDSYHTLHLPSTSYSLTTPTATYTGMNHHRTIPLSPLSPTINLTISPPPPSLPSHLCPDPLLPTANEKCGQGGDHKLGNYTGAAQYATGWDWAIAIPDRITGFLQQPYITHTGPLTLSHLHVDTLNISDIEAGVAGVAYLNITLTISSLEPSPTTATVTLTLPGTTITLPPATYTTQTLSHTLMLTSVPLWYPWQLGSPTLHNCTATISINSTISDVASRSYGVRTVSTSIHPVTLGRTFLVNSLPLFLQGGNWIESDSTHTATNSARYQHEVRLHKAAGMNLIRVWGGGVTEQPEFYRACNEQGMLVMQEFWMSGDNNGRWGGSVEYPHDQEEYVEAVEDVVKRVRGEPSLLFWCGGNELFAEPPLHSPSQYIQAGMRAAVASLDPTRFLIMSSMDGGLDGLDMLQHDEANALAVKDGPYGFLYPVQYYAELNPGMVNGSDVQVAFQPEVGGASMPRMSGVSKMLGQDPNSTDVPSEMGVYVPPLWDLHKYEGYGINNTVDAVYMYGVPANTADYVAAANIACLQQYQALFEGFTRKMFKPGNEGGKTAIILWKSQSPWPAMRGFLYDWWLETVGTFEGVRKGTGGGNVVHAQLDLAGRTVEIVNRGVAGIEKSDVVVDFFDLRGRSVMRTQTITVGEVARMSVATSGERVAFPTTSDAVFFARLALNGEETWYWMNTDPATGEYSYDYSSLGEWRRAGPVGSVKGKLEDGALKIKVTGDAVVFAAYIQVFAADGTQILPVIASVPTVIMNDGEEVAIHVEVLDEDAVPERLVIKQWAGEDVVVMF